MFIRSKYAKTTAYCTLLTQKLLCEYSFVIYEHLTSEMLLGFGSVKANMYCNVIRDDSVNDDTSDRIT